MLKAYPAKVLLLGEYTILHGPKALALPYHALHGEWSFEEDHSERAKNSRDSLKSLLSHLNSSNSSAINTTLLQEDLQKGLWFKSSIPQGFGLGSSGAVIAALFEHYGIPIRDFYAIKRQLGELENYFHGQSSGLDPLVSLIQKPLLIHGIDHVECLEVMPELKGFFLLNTGRPRQTGPLVSIYQEKMKNPQFKKGCADVLTREVNLAIDAVISNNSALLFHHLWHISKFQLDFFSEMIPTEQRALWTRGLESGDYILKLCGAGGGGLILGYRQKFDLPELRSVLGTDELRELS